MNLFTVMNEYIETKKNDHTKKANRNDFYRFLEFLLKNRKDASPGINALNDNNAEAYRDHLLDDPHTEISTASRRLTHLKALSRWLNARGQLSCPLQLRIPRADERVCPAGLTEDEEIALRRAAFRLVECSSSSNHSSRCKYEQRNRYSVDSRGNDKKKRTGCISDFPIRNRASGWGGHEFKKKPISGE
jgi:site-specific recombinase XerD